MYKLLLCWRYLLSRYIALASVVSVMLGVATLIVVNAVMLGFTTEMKDRIHGILSDVIFESRSMDGFPDANWHMDKIMEVAGDKIEALTPTVVVPAMLSYQHKGSGEINSVGVQLVGIDVLTQDKVSDVAKYLQHPANRERISFELHQGGYDVFSQGDPAKAAFRPEMRNAGWFHRKYVVAEIEKMRKRDREAFENQRSAIPVSSAAVPLSEGPAPFPDNPFAEHSAAAGPDGGAPNPFMTAPSKATVEQIFDPAEQTHCGVIVGFGISHWYRGQTTDPQTGETRITDSLSILPGDDITLTLPMTDIPPKLKHDRFTVVDLYECKMKEYDTMFVFVPLEKLQDLRNMVDPHSGRRMVSQILIKAKPGADLNELRDILRHAFPSYMYSVSTWADRQEAILAAVAMEIRILNVLLFLIIAVAGFGILAIFFMIVVEKTKDIGILKSLGAGSWGVMQIFLYYSFALGVVGSGGGMILGLLFVHYIREIADMLSTLMGHDVFDPNIYMFYEIPTIIDPWTICWVVLGAVGIAVAAGVLPALRAARMHPVEALRT